MEKTDLPKLGHVCLLDNTALSKIVIGYDTENVLIGSDNTKRLDCSICGNVFANYGAMADYKETK